MLAALKHRYRLAVSRRREAKKRVNRSPRWPHVEKLHLALHGRCAGCGSTVHLQVHHRKPFHLHPELELEPTNLITLCMDGPECHLRIGHGSNFRGYNPGVDPDAAQSLKHPPSRPEIWARAKAAQLLASKH